MHGTGIVGQNVDYNLLVLGNEDNYFVSKGKVVDKDRYDNESFQENVDKALEVTEQNIKSIYGTSSDELNEDFENLIGRTLDNYVTPIDDNVYFFTIAGDIVQVSKYSSGDTDFGQLGNINFVDNTSDFERVVDSVDYYAVCDKFGYFNSDLDKMLNDNADYTLDNVVYNDGVIFVQIVDADNNITKVYEYNSQNREFNYVTKIETSGIKNIYILK